MLTNACHFLAQSHATRNVYQQQLQTSKPNQQISLRHADVIYADSKFTSTSYKSAVEMLSGVAGEISIRVLHQSLSDRVSYWYLIRFVLVGSSSNADVDFRRWCFSCDGQQRALRDFEATTFCEQEPAVGFVSVFRSGFLPDFSGPRCGERNRFKDARASGNTALSSPCWDLLAPMCRVANLPQFIDFVELCLSSLAPLLDCSLRLLSRIPCIAYAFYLCLLLFLFSCSPYWGPMSLWGCCVCCLCVVSGFPGYSAGRGVGPAGGAPRGA
ncbi:hypothetical protein F511_11825 [Dorcoceras hygrometricum]|uniref:Uncharacterized protein n=1 Tax=Dorcoceras hygrometricum TaxID=472368 RepID=A0A2Z7AT76_9LAMI|nr:hypothetical protein F511_11825 [Dorcoceras hygrometricum]